MTDIPLEAPDREHPIECKSPAVVEPMMTGITQLLRYANQRQDVAEPEGVPHLFHCNQLLISTWFYEARAAALGAQYEHYQEWKDTAPVPRARVAAELGKPEAQLKSQELLVAGLLRPAHLLDILQNFILFNDRAGKLIKLIPRYPQFRAVHGIIERLSEGRPRRAPHEPDQRGGVVWHHQGSGKSITMTCTVRKLRNIPALRDFKVVLVTDRTQLEKQLRETLILSGQNLRPNEQDQQRQESLSAQVQRILREPGPDLVFCMIQKNRDEDQDSEMLEYEIPLPAPRLQPDGADLPPGALTVAQTHTLRQHVAVSDAPFPLLNPSPNILVLVDKPTAVKPATCTPI